MKFLFGLLCIVPVAAHTAGSALVLDDECAVDSHCAVNALQRQAQKKVSQTSAGIELNGHIVGSSDSCLAYGYGFYDDHNFRTKQFYGAECRRYTADNVWHYDIARKTLVGSVHCLTAENSTSLTSSFCDNDDRQKFDFDNCEDATWTCVGLIKSVKFGTCLSTADPSKLQVCDGNDKMQAFVMHDRRFNNDVADMVKAAESVIGGSKILLLARHSGSQPNGQYFRSATTNRLQLRPDGTCRFVQAHEEIDTWVRHVDVANVNFYVGKFTVKDGVVQTTWTDQWTCQQGKTSCESMAKDTGASYNLLDRWELTKEAASDNLLGIKLNSDFDRVPTDFPDMS